MQDDPDDDDDHPEEQEENSQEEFINSDEFSSSIRIDLNQTGPSMFTKRSKTVKEKTGNFHCIVNYPYWGHHVKKKRALLLFPCGGVEKSKKYQNNKNARECLGGRMAVGESTPRSRSRC
jgi:hypothetical protein